MSQPGDPGRTQLVATDPGEVVVMTARLVEQHGGVSFEHGYGPPPGVEWDDDHQPGPDEDVLWYAQAVIRHKVAGRRPFTTTYRGEALVKAGASHARGGSYACIDLLEQMGANTIVVDMNDTPPPRRTDG